MTTQEPFTVTRARYAKGMMAVQVHDNRDGFKGRTARLCDALKGRWSNREGAYIMSPNKVKKLQSLYAKGWDATIIARRLYAPGEWP